MGVSQAPESFISRATSAFLPSSGGSKGKSPSREQRANQATARASKTQAVSFCGDNNDRRGSMREIYQHHSATQERWRDRVDRRCGISGRERGIYSACLLSGTKFTE